MASTIKVKRSSVPNKAPTTTDLALGELAVNTYEGKIYLKKNNGTESIVEVANIDSPTFTGNVTATDKLISSNSSGDEGGEILLAKPQTNSTLVGTGVTIDVYQNKLRIFEQGGSARGAYIDLTATNSGVGTNLLTGGIGTVTSVSGSGTVSGLTLTGTVTGSGSLTLGGALALSSGDVTGALGFTPYNATNPSGYITSASLIASNITGDFLDGVFAIENSTDATKRAVFSLASIATATTQTYTLPNASGTVALLSGTQTFSSATTFSTTTGTLNFGTSATSGVLNVGGTSGTGILTLGRSTVSQTTNIQAGATASGSTKTINFGTGGLTGSTTTMAIGSAFGTTVAANGTWTFSTDIVGNISGNAATATTLQTTRNINGVSFNGSADITVADATKLPLAGGTMTGAISFAAGQTWPTLNQSTTGSAATLTTARTISLTGDVAYTSDSFNGSTNVTGTATLAAVGSAGTYTKVTTDSKGRVTSGTTLAAADIPSLDAAKITSGTIDAARLPSYVDDVVEAANLAAFPATGETGKIYVALDTNKTYRWSGSAYVYITSGAVDSVAGKTGVVTLVKADVGLGSVTNTSDAAKPVSTAQQAALDLKANLASPTFTGTVGGITAAMVGLGSVENKSSATIRGEITSANVTGALGYTPYNATNPNGYITSSGSISGNAATAGSVSGLTLTSSANGINPDSVTQNQLGYNTSISLFGQTDGGLYSSAYSSSWIHQIYGDFRSGQIAVRGRNSGTWQAWRVVLDSGNYNSYAMPSGSSATNSVDVRAPIFYDSNDTGYYIDPASTSNSALRMRGGALFGPNTTWGAYLYVGGNGNVTGNATVCTTDGNIHIDANDTNHGIYLGYYTGDYTRIYNSARSPTFYDLDDTSYYVNPANTSNLAATYINTHLYTSYSQYNPVIQTSGVGESGLLLRDGAGSFRVQIYGASGVYGFLNSAWGSWDLKKPTGGNLYLNGQETYYYGSTQTYVERVYGVNDIRAPLYYDYDNTGYYIDPNSSSRLATVNADTLRSYNNIYLDNQYGSSIIGVYSSYRYQGIFAMGDAYKLAMDGTTTGSLYGMAWSHPNAGGTASNLNSHGLLLLQNGSFMAALSTNGTFSADVRGTIFYDYSNTGYYCDPSSASYLYSLSLSGASYFQPNTWIQFNDAYGLYWPNNNGAHLQANSLSSYSSLAIRGSKGGYGGILDYYSGIAWMNDSSGNGGFYREANGRWYMYYNISNDCWGFGDSGTSSTWNATGPKGFNAGTRMDSPIYYDANNTGYYLDPNSNSRVYGIYADVIYSYGNVTAYHSSDRKFKENIRAIPNALEIVKAVGGKLFDWTDEYLQAHGGEDGYFLQKSDFGVVAQDLLPHLPQAVRTRQDGSLAVDYEKLCAVAFEAINTLETRLAALERALANK